MQDNKLVDPERISLVDFKILKGQVDTPENFDLSKVVGHQLDNSLQLGFNLEDKLAKADFTVSVKTNSKGENENEAVGNFHLIFIYRIDNLEDLAISDKNKKLHLNPDLASTLSSVSYSTSRGILLTSLQGSALQKFVLPIVNPSNLLRNP